MSFKTRTRSIVTASLLASAVALSLQSQQARAEYPDKPVEIIIAWAAGGATDLVTRAVQSAFSENLGADIVVKNIAGAAGTIGTAQAARAKPDGHTVLFTPTGPLTTQPHLRKLPYDIDSFDPVGRIAITQVVMMTPKTTPYKTLQDVIDAGKANPGGLKFASTGVGTLPHIAILSLDMATGNESKHIPYKGSANAVKALLGGEVELFSDQAQLIPKYDLHPVVSWSPERLPEYPDTPTLIESGFDFSMANWSGVFVPKGTPKPVIKKLSDALQKSLTDPGVMAAMEKLKVIIDPMEPEAFGKFALADYKRNRDLLGSAGLLKKD